MPDALKPGDRLFWNYDLERWDPTEVTIGKIGRKWALCDPPENYHPGFRINVQTLETDAACIYGKLYWSLDDWQRQRGEYKVRVDADAAWEEFRSRIYGTWRVPDGLTADVIREAMRMVFRDA